MLVDERYKLMLHILRNPHGWDESHQREARLQAADLIEELTRALEYAKKKKQTRNFVGYGLFSNGTLVTCSKQELAICIGGGAIECLPLYVHKDAEE